MRITIPIILCASVLGFSFVGFVTHGMILLSSRAWMARQNNGGRKCWMKSQHTSPDGIPGVSANQPRCQEAQFSETQDTVRQRTDYHFLCTIFMQQTVGDGIHCFDRDGKNAVLRQPRYAKACLNCGNPSTGTGQDPVRKTMSNGLTTSSDF